MYILRVQVSPPFVPRQRSNQPLTVNVTVVDELGQLVAGSGVKHGPRLDSVSLPPLSRTHHPDYPNLLAMRCPAP